MCISNPSGEWERKCEVLGEGGEFQITGGGGGKGEEREGGGEIQSTGGGGEGE